MYFRKAANLLYYWSQFTIILPCWALDMVLRAPFMLIGYACISPDDPHLVLQRQALMAAGCGEIFEERGSWKRVRARLTLRHVLDACAGGDTLVVWRLDRLGRSAQHAIEIISNLAARGVAVRALAEEIDTAAPEAAVALRLTIALAKFQHSAKSRGDRLRLSPNGRGPIVRPPRRPLGCPRKITPEQIERARRLIAAGGKPVAVARSLGVTYQTMRRSLVRLRKTIELQAASIRADV